METKQCNLSRTRINRLKAQGFMNLSDSEISELAFGSRFALASCTTIFGIGVATANVPILLGMALVAFGGIVLPNHPFDYIYNYILSNRLNKPKLPPRSNQLKFACTIASTGLATTAFLFYSGYNIAGYILGVSLFMVAFTVSTTDFCIPSMIYNFIFKIKIDK